MPQMAGCDRVAEAMSCAQCGSEFVCGPEQKGGHCWCHYVPHFMPSPGATDKCLCPACLEQARARHA